MQRRRSLLVVVLAVVAGGTVVCRNPEQKTARTSERAAPVAAPRTATERATPVASPSSSVPSTAAVSKGWVACEATLTEVNPRFRWFDNHGGSHDDGVSLLATYRVTAPTAHAGRKVGILFKYAKRLTPPTPAQVGQRFTFEVPAGYFAGKAWIMDNLTARALAPRSR